MIILKKLAFSLFKMLKGKQTKKCHWLTLEKEICKWL